MRALVKYAKGPGMIEMRETPVPEPGPGEAIVRVKAAAVCASDVHILHDCFTYEPLAIATVVLSYSDQLLS